MPKSGLFSANRERESLYSPKIGQRFAAACLDRSALVVTRPLGMGTQSV
jgi:hypothetical protein